MQGCRVGGCSEHRSQRLPRLKPRVTVLRREYTAHDFERGFEATSLLLAWGHVCLVSAGWPSYSCVFPEPSRRAAE